MLATTTHSSKLLLIKMKVNILLGICDFYKKTRVRKKIGNDARDTIAQLTRKTRLGARGYAGMVDRADLKSAARLGVWVRVPLSPKITFIYSEFS